MKILVEMTKKQSQMLITSAEQLGIEPESLVNAIVSEQLDDTNNVFKNSMNYILNKNNKLYNRLS